MTALWASVGVITILLLLVYRYMFTTTYEISNETLFREEGPQALAASTSDGFEAVKALPWPRSLPGFRQIDKYRALKRHVLAQWNETETEDKFEARQQLRHALMDRCQVHITWLLRVEREQQSIERMARRGMMSEADLKKFSRFSQLLDAEVNDVRHEAGWLCDDLERSQQASEEIWRIAVQIWNQRRQEDAARARSLRVTTDDAARRRDAGSGVKGLKGGFLGKVIDSRPSTSRQFASTQPAFKPMTWPETHPRENAIQEYELIKAGFLNLDNNETIGEARQCLRDALLQRCQQQIPWILSLRQEQQRTRSAMERARWQSSETPRAEYLSTLQDFENKCKMESASIQEEAEWLGGQNGTPGMGEKIWSMAFELHAKADAQNTKRERLLQVHQEKILQTYAEGTAKPWPADLPGVKQRSTYDQMKSTVLQQLSQPAQAAMLGGHTAPRVVGEQAARQLRAALMARCQQVIPLIQRLQAEGFVFNKAVKLGHVNKKDIACFGAIDSSVKGEIEAVKNEANWLSDNTGTNAAMGDQIWPAAFQIYTRRRAEVTKQIQTAQMNPLSIQSVIADVVD